MVHDERWLIFFSKKKKKRKENEKKLIHSSLCIVYPCISARDEPNPGGCRWNVLFESTGLIVIAESPLDQSGGRKGDTATFASRVEQINRDRSSNNIGT